MSTNTFNDRIRQALVWLTVLLTGCAGSPARQQDQTVRRLSEFRGWHIMQPAPVASGSDPYRDARIQAVGQRCLAAYMSGVRVIDHQLVQNDDNLASRSRGLQRASVAAQQLDRRLQRCAQAEGVELTLAVVTGAGVMPYPDWLAALARAFDASGRWLQTLDVDHRIDLPVVALTARAAGTVLDDSYLSLGEFQELGLPASSYPAPAYSP